MNDPSLPGDLGLAEKIACLVKERGWNQEDLARISGLNRQTIRQILQPTGARRLRNATVGACARALGLSVNDLHHAPLERLLQQVGGPRLGDGDATLHRLYDQATQPQLYAWMERNPERAKQLTQADIDELLSLQGTGGPLTSLGVEHYVKQIERKRRLIEQVHAIAGTDKIDLLEQLVALIYETIQPYRDRG